MPCSSTSLTSQARGNLSTPGSSGGRLIDLFSTLEWSGSHLAPTSCSLLAGDLRTWLLDRAP